jgi:hypothetical protein
MKLLGIVDHVNDCDCCGKTGLVKTVALESNGETVYYGTTCASIALGFGREYTTRTAHKLVERVKKNDHYKKLKECAVMQAQQKANKTNETWLVLFKTSKYQKLGWYSIMEQSRYIALNSPENGRISAEVKPTN